MGLVYELRRVNYVTVCGVSINIKMETIQEKVQNLCEKENMRHGTKHIPTYFLQDVWKAAQEEAFKEVGKQIDAKTELSDVIGFLDKKLGYSDKRALNIDYTNLCQHLYSKSMDQDYPRKCTKCGEVENK